jgi:Flp pilus assembly pilin Flp
MMSFVKRLIAEESGQDLAEYGIALAVIAIGAAAAAVVIAGDVQTLWESGRDAIQSALP